MPGDLEALAELAPDWLEELRVKGNLGEREPMDALLRHGLPRSVRALRLTSELHSVGYTDLSLGIIAAALEHVEDLHLTAWTLDFDAPPGEGRTVVLPSVRALSLHLRDACRAMGPGFTRRLRCPNLRALRYSLFGYKQEWAIVDFLEAHPACRSSWTREGAREHLAESARMRPSGAILLCLAIAALGLWSTLSCSNDCFTSIEVISSEPLPDGGASGGDPSLFGDFCDAVCVPALGDGAYACLAVDAGPPVVVSCYQLCPR